MGKDLKKSFSKEGLQRAGKHTKRYLASFVIREMQSKTTGRYHFLAPRMDEAKSEITVSVDEDEGMRTETSICWWGWSVRGARPRKTAA